MTMTFTHSHSQTANGATRDVEAELAQQRAEKRRQAADVSPLVFHKDLLVGDDWNCLFLIHLCRGVVSLHEFKTPPLNVLDVGCGTGLWCIQAAKQWPDATIVGFDLRDVQPNLTLPNLGFETRDLSKRIKWVHGDLLHGLPFEDNTFDFVRMCAIGLEVPEDSWQELLEECARILKPGCGLEVFDEDLIFPAGRTRIPDPPEIRDVHFRSLSGERVRSDSAASKMSTLSTSTTQSTQTSYSTKTTQSSASASSTNPLVAKPPQAITTEHTTHSVSLDSYLSSSSSGSDDSKYTQDHARLRNAWEEMLSQRFLSHRLLSVLPFYFSTFFTNVSVHPTMQILLPPRSSEREVGFLDKEIPLEGEGLEQWLSDMWAGMVRLTEGGDRKAKSAALKARPPTATVTTWNVLHLVRAVRRITACKEAIWEAYRKLEGVQDHRGSQKGEPPRDDLRDEFERDWKAWELDMKDRMGVRDHIQDALSWKDPDSAGRVQYLSGGKKSGYDKNEPDPEKAPLARAMRGFAGWKAAAS